jgi:hypothetical protein
MLIIGIVIGASRGTTSTEFLRRTPPYAASILTGVSMVGFVVVIENEAELWPAGTVTVDGTLAA